MLRCLLLVAFLFAASACQTHQQYIYVPIAVGASQEDVRTSLGEPLRVERTANEETWFYADNAVVIFSEGVVARTSSPSIRIARPTIGGYGDISPSTGRPKTVAVRGYYRKDGTYVRPHYRSTPRRR